MAQSKPVNRRIDVRGRPPVTVWLITVLMSLMAFVSIVGSLLFAFPMGGFLGYLAGVLLVVIGIGYATLAWRLRFGEHAVWLAALALPIIHTVSLNTLDLVVFGAIPSENYPFMGVALVIVILLLLPPTRRYFGR